MKDDYATNPHYLTRTSRWENVLFELGSERVKTIMITVMVTELKVEKNCSCIRDI